MAASCRYCMCWKENRAASNTYCGIEGANRLRSGCGCSCHNYSRGCGGAVYPSPMPDLFMESEADKFIKGGDLMVRAAKELKAKNLKNRKKVSKSNKPSKYALKQLEIEPTYDLFATMKHLWNKLVNNKQCK